MWCHWHLMFYDCILFKLTAMVTGLTILVRTHKFSFKLNYLDPCAPKNCFSCHIKVINVTSLQFLVISQHICSSDLWTWDWVFVLSVEWLQCRMLTGLTTFTKASLGSPHCPWRAKNSSSVVAFTSVTVLCTPLGRALTYDNYNSLGLTN